MTLYFADGTRVDGATNFNGDCIEEEFCNIFSMEEYIPNDQRIIELPEDF